MANFPGRVESKHTSNSPTRSLNTAPTPQILPLRSSHRKRKNRHKFTPFMPVSSALPSHNFSKLGSMLPVIALFSLLAASEDEARKVLSSRCGACHRQDALSTLKLDSGRDIKPVFLKAISGGGDGVKSMPPGKKLTPQEQSALQSWFNSGAKLSTPHWSWQPLKPAVGSIDEYAKPSGTPVDRRTLTRRLHFDITGLPPTSLDKDNSPGWQTRLIDKLLASPHYGEHWGRHWLDVARYGEDDFSGTAVQPYPNAWRYRDWVINATNRNLPYNQFLTAQLAADLTPNKTELGGLGLTGLGPWYYGISQPPQARADERHDRVDMVTRGMLGVTLACARCHDHKYDPFTQKDYYALSGVFASTAYKEYPLVPEAEATKWQADKKALDEAEKKLNKFLDDQANRLREVHAKDMWRYMVATIKSDPVDLNLELFNRWCNYLSRPEEFHPYLKDWFANPSEQTARTFEKLMIEISAEKKQLDADNKLILEAAEKVAVKPKRTIVLPGGYRSEEDFNPGADVAIKSLPRDRFVAYNRTFIEGGAPLRFPADLVPKFLNGPLKAEYDSLKATRDQLKKQLPPKYAYIDGIGEFEPWDLNIDKRGNPEDLGEIVPRRFPLVLSNNQPLLFNQGSGRLQLAETVTNHPLAARVAVNRIWLHLFGEAIVKTPSNFGLAGDRPTNPQLLEYLAARFVALNYDQKALIKEILLSETYQRSNLRKRLSAEPLRDAMLTASGRLDATIGGPSAELNDKLRRRTVYAKTGRFEANETLALFDVPNAAVTCEQRVSTNVPLQKLFYLNSEIIAAEAEALGQRLRKLGLNKGYQLLFQRNPTTSEKQAAKQFFKDGGTWPQYAQVLLSTNEFAYVD